MVYLVADEVDSAVDELDIPPVSVKRKSRGHSTRSSSAPVLIPLRRSASLSLSALSCHDRPSWSVSMHGDSSSSPLFSGPGQVAVCFSPIAKSEEFPDSPCSLRSSVKSEITINKEGQVLPPRAGEPLRIFTRNLFRPILNHRRTHSAPILTPKNRDHVRAHFSDGTVHDFPACQSIDHVRVRAAIYCNTFAPSISLRDGNLDIIVRPLACAPPPSVFVSAANVPADDAYWASALYSHATCGDFDGVARIAALVDPCRFEDFAVSTVYRIVRQSCTVRDDEKRLASAVACLMRLARNEGTSKASCTYREMQEESALHICCAAKPSMRIAKVLLAAKADPNIRRVGDLATPLFGAARNNNRQCAKLLVAWGADASAKNIHGMTPVDIARELGYSAMSTLLESHQSNTFVPRLPGVKSDCSLHAPRCESGSSDHSHASIPRSVRGQRAMERPQRMKT